MGLGDNGSLILYDNIVEDSILTPSSTGSGAIDNLKDQKLYTIWQADGAGYHSIIIDRGITKTINSIGIIGHNFNTKNVSELTFKIYSDDDEKTAGLIAGAYKTGRGTIYLHSGVSNFVFTSFQSPNLWPMGLAFDTANKRLISCDDGSGKIYIHSGISSTIIDSFYFGTILNGLAYDATTGNLISSDIGEVRIYIHSGISATIIDQWYTGYYYTALTIANNNLISGSAQSDRIRVHNGISPQITISFAAPAFDIHGLAYDGTNLYSSDWATNKIYVHSGITGIIINSFSSGDASAQKYGGAGLTFDTSGTIFGSGSVNSLFSSLTPQNDKIIFKTFPDSTDTKWELTFIAGSADPKIGVLTIGSALEMPKFPIIGYSPDSQQSIILKQNAQIGNFLENTINFTNRELSPAYENLPISFITGDFKTFWETYAKYGKPFIYAWNYGKYPDDVFWVVIKDGFRLFIPYNPILRNIELNLIGLVE